MTQTYKTYIGARTWRNRMISQAARKQVTALAAPRLPAPSPQRDESTQGNPITGTLSTGTLGGSYFANTTAFLDLLKNFRGGFCGLRLTK